MTDIQQDKELYQNIYALISDAQLAQYDEDDDRNVAALVAIEIHKLVQARDKEIERKARIDELKAIFGWSMDNREVLIIPVENRSLSAQQKVVSHKLLCSERIEQLEELSS